MRNRLPFLAIVLIAGSVVFSEAVRCGETEFMDIARINQFIARWDRAKANELGNAQLFTTELMALLDVGRPEPSRQESKLNKNGFERQVTLVGPDGRKSSGRLDYYLAGHLVLESKQSASKDPTPFPYPLTPEQRQYVRSAGSRRGSAIADTSGWDLMMEKAFAQAEKYARSLPPDEAFPPFLLVVDVARCIDVYANFDREMGYYAPFPSAREHRIRMTDLRDPAIFTRLRTIWIDPLSLDASRENERVTVELARRLGDLAVALEEDGHDAGEVANFLMRFICTAYLEDVRLLPAGAFTRFMEAAVERPESFAPQLGDIWGSMTEGGPCQTFGVEVSHFGPFFQDSPVPSLTPEQLRLLADAARTHWGNVDPVIFGAILERALSNKERFKLGAYFTSRTIVDRLILPSVIGQLRAEWNEARNLAWNQLSASDIDGARRTVFEFQKRLSRATVLDPAAGSGNLLFVTYWRLKGLEEEVVAVLKDLGVYEWLEVAPEYFVSPKQLYGIEVNPKAAAVGSLILHLSYLQWHVRVNGYVKPPEPILREKWAIDCRDAVLAWDRTEPVTDGDSRPRTRWDGQTFRIDPDTGKQTPDETARVAAVRYVNPRPAEWPETEFVIANPPYIGGSKRREALGDEYNQALTAAYPWIPKSADYCVYWVDKAARLTRSGKLSSCAFITTSTIKQGRNRDLIRPHLTGKPMPMPSGETADAPPLSIVHAIPDHDWSGDGASVKVSLMTYRAGVWDGVLARYKSEGERWRDPKTSPFEYEAGRINAGLTIGPDVSVAVTLKANVGLANRGVEPAGTGFVVTSRQAALFGLGRIQGLENHIRHYRNGRDIATKSRGALVIDLYGLSEQQVKERFPEVYEWVLAKVKPERNRNNRESRVQNWWIFGEPRPGLRAAHQGLHRFIVTPQTAARRYFVFLDADIFPDTALIAIASDDAYILGVLSSQIHAAWATAAGNRRGDGPRYNNTVTFDPFPFPVATPEQADRIRLWAERLDAHRKERQAAFPELTLTGLYAAYYKLRVQEDLNVTDMKMADWGDLECLAAIQAELDAAVADAYGWPAEMSDTEITQRLLDLNHARATEEKAGQVRYLRPEYQNPQTAPERPTEPRSIPSEKKETVACQSFFMVAA